MVPILKVYKPVGATPLEMIKKVKQEHPEYRSVKMAYAGRLDPMAEGLVLLLVGEECKNRAQYQRLPKEYEFEVLFGIATDSYDVLGKIVAFKPQRPANLHLKLKQWMSQLKGQQHQAYPPYSSKRVQGKPLFYWAREQKLDTITIPTKIIEIYSIQLVSQMTASSSQLLETVKTRIHSVKGPFRQEEVLEIWQKTVAPTNEQFAVMKLRVGCSAGTYVRGLVHELGEKLHVPTVTYSIKRTRIGEFEI